MQKARGKMKKTYTEESKEKQERKKVVRKVEGKTNNEKKEENKNKNEIKSINLQGSYRNVRYSVLTSALQFSVSVIVFWKSEPTR